MLQLEWKRAYDVFKDMNLLDEENKTPCVVEGAIEVTQALSLTALISSVFCFVPCFVCGSCFVCGPSWL